MTRKTLTIFEGVDGSGKTTAAKAYAEGIGAEYVHFGNYPDIVDNELSRVYLRAMEALIVERKHVVFDRSWLSEKPYGIVFRGGLYRMHENAAAELEGYAMMFDPIVVFCDPGLETCLENYRSRRQLEMLENEEQLTQVYHLYKTQRTLIPAVVYNYKTGENITPAHIEKIRSHFYGQAQL